VHESVVGTDRRTGVCGTDRCYQASSRHQPACQALLPRLKMTPSGPQPSQFPALQRASDLIVSNANLERESWRLLAISSSAFHVVLAVLLHPFPLGWLGRGLIWTKGQLLSY
jgi:hypothetical protein